MNNFIVKFWNNLRLKNQIFILQGFAIAVTFSILVVLSYEMVISFYQFIQHELLQSLILKSMISTIQNTVLRVGRIGKIGYLQQQADHYSLENLYYFQVQNDIQMTSQVDNCLQTEHTKQFYTYQFCYGIYGQISNSTDFNQIKQYIALQNLFIPLKQLEETKANYNLLMDESLFFSQYKGEQLTEITKDIQDAIYFMEFYQQPIYFQQVIGETGQMMLVFKVIQGTKIAIGYLYNQNQQLYYKLTSRKEYFQQRSIGVLESGLIFSDTEQWDINGLQFQNTSLTGFNQDQFEKIKNYIKIDNTVENECQQKVNSKVLCLVDVDKQEKLIFPKLIDNGNGMPFYVIAIADANRLKDIENEFNQQVRIFINKIIFIMVVCLFFTLLSCLVIQIILVLKLNQPLQKLQELAKFHTNGQLYNMMSHMKLIKAQSQLQQLTDAFVNLVYQINSKTKSELVIQGKLQDQRVEYSGGLLAIRYYRNSAKLIRRYLKNSSLK